PNRAHRSHAPARSVGIGRAVARSGGPALRSRIMNVADRWAGLDRAVRERAGANAREAVPVPPATDRDAWSRVDPASARAILDRADEDRRLPWPHPALSDYARYWRDGVRTAYETPA